MKSNTVSIVLRQLSSEVRFRRHSHIIICAYCFSAGLSIALAQITLIALAILWVNFAAHNREKTREMFVAAQPFCQPLGAWLLISLIATFTGMVPTYSLLELLKAIPYYLLPLYILTSLSFERDATTRLECIKVYLSLLFCGQILASIHTFLSVGAGLELKPRTPGPVTEAGQLALQIPCLIALFCVLRVDNLERKLGLASVLCAAFIFSAWAHFIVPLEHTGILQVLFFSLSIAISLWYLRQKGVKQGHWKEAVVTVAAAFFVAAFVLNLKRGPWLGVGVGVALFALFSHRYHLLGYLSAAILSSLLLSPVRIRLLDFVKDFSISGGRETMWSLGLSLVERYPLGVGPFNAEVMQVIDPSLPWSHQHMHNNLLNVAVEYGLLGLGIFTWWMLMIILLGIKIWQNNRKEHFEHALIALGLSCALIAWQVAGIVEYNFGDGEVKLIAFFLMGLVLALGYPSLQDKRP